MLRIKEPVKLKSYNNMCILDDRFAKRIQANYNLFPLHFTTEELLYLMQGNDAEQYIEQHNMTCIVNNAHYNNNITLDVEVINEFINRFFEIVNEKYTYQDRMYIDRFLVKAGIHNVNSFVKNAIEYINDTKAMKSEVEFINSNEHFLSGILKELAENNNNSNTQLIDEYLSSNRQQLIMQFSSRLLSHVINGDNKKLMAYNTTYKKSYADITAIMSNSQYQKLELYSEDMKQNAIFNDNTISVQLHNNPYEVIWQDCTTKKKVLEQLISASLLNVLESVELVKQKDADTGIQLFIDEKNNLSDIITSTVLRMVMGQNRTTYNINADNYKELKLLRKEQCNIYTQLVEAYRNVLRSSQHFNNFTDNYVKPYTVLSKELNDNGDVLNEYITQILYQDDNDNYIENHYHIDKNVISNNNYHINENVILNDNHHISENVISDENHHIDENVTSNDNYHINENVISNKNHHINENVISNENHNISENVVSNNNHYMNENVISNENIKIQIDREKAKRDILSAFNNPIEVINEYNKTATDVELYHQKQKEMLYEGLPQDSREIFEKVEKILEKRKNNELKIMQESAERTLLEDTESAQSLITFEDYEILQLNEIEEDNSDVSGNADNVIKQQDTQNKEKETAMPSDKQSGISIMDYQIQVLKEALIKNRYAKSIYSLLVNGTDCYNELAEFFEDRSGQLNITTEQTEEKFYEALTYILKECANDEENVNTFAYSERILADNYNTTEHKNYNTAEYKKDENNQNIETKNNENNTSYISEKVINKYINKYISQFKSKEHNIKNSVRNIINNIESINNVINKASSIKDIINNDTNINNAVIDKVHIDSSLTDENSSDLVYNENIFMTNENNQSNTINTTEGDINKYVNQSITENVIDNSIIKNNNINNNFNDNNMTITGNSNMEYFDIHSSQQYVEYIHNVLNISESLFQRSGFTDYNYSINGEASIFNNKYTFADGITNVKGSVSSYGDTITNMGDISFVYNNEQQADSEQAAQPVNNSIRQTENTAYYNSNITLKDNIRNNRISQYENSTVQGLDNTVKNETHKYETLIEHTIQRNVERTIENQIASISEKVYSNLEKRLSMERKRRGF